MLKPNFTFTPKLLNNISQIERLYGQLEGLRVPQKLELNLEQRNLVQSSYVSNSIEGNPLSHQEVTNLLLDERIPVNRDEKEVHNYYEILKRLDQYKDKDFSIDIIKDLHQQLLTGVRDKIAGDLRNRKVVIGKYNGDGEDKENFSLEVKHEPPYHKKEEIKKALNKLFDWAKDNQQPTVIAAGIFHHHFVYIHPFVDGNGRVCRLMTTLKFLKDDYKINKYFVLDDFYDIDRMQYSDKLHTADEGDKTEWLEYFSDGVKYSLQSSLAKIKEGLSQLKVEDRPTSRESEVLEFIKDRKEVTSSDIAKKFDVSRQQAHNLLSSLVDKGFLAKKGATKSSYYTLR